MAKPCSVQFPHSASRGSKCQLWEADYCMSGNQLNRVDSDTYWNDTECKKQIVKRQAFGATMKDPQGNLRTVPKTPWKGEESTKEALGRTNLPRRQKGQRLQEAAKTSGVKRSPL